MPYRLIDKYPGMRPRDEVIWDEFVRLNPSAFDYVYYDVHMGEPTSDPREKQRMLANGSYEVSQWCVDALAIAGEVEHVIEIKPNAGAGALGQALAYVKLLQAEGRVSDKAVPVVLTDVLSPITEQAAKALGVIVIVP